MSNIKPIFMWSSMFGIATCVALHSWTGVGAFAVLTILVRILA